jgi:hypothetical protein
MVGNSVVYLAAPRRSLLVGADSLNLMRQPAATRWAPRVRLDGGSGARPSVVWPQTACSSRPRPGVRSGANDKACRTAADAPAANCPLTGAQHRPQGVASVFLPGRQEARSQLQEPQVAVSFDHESVEVGSDDAGGHGDHQSQELQTWASGYLQAPCRPVWVPPVVVPSETASGGTEKHMAWRSDRGTGADFVAPHLSAAAPPPQRCAQCASPSARGLRCAIHRLIASGQLAGQLLAALDGRGTIGVLEDEPEFIFDSPPA